MSKSIWVVVGWGWLVACTEPGGNGNGVDARRQQERACILQRLPPQGDTASGWEVSGYVLVDAYVKCKETPSEASAEDFSAVVQGLATGVQGDASRVRIIAPSGGSP
ncbi:MAG TPA: hypothetical protein VFZ09_09310 [Archangium sp.]|uniref:hypothetical protein n=1 Tax=Archangium sp. TaxID=1872627 RepID=UPI002E319816|nr:hypothetical protein [Archangium sp.]HEX5746432.1 hypothetical protein [Archangium sp.]